MRKITHQEFPDRSVERLFKATMDPNIFATKDVTLATVANLSHTFDEGLDELILDSMSNKIVRNGVANITADTKAQRDLFLLANFGVDTVSTELVVYHQQLPREELLDTLTRAKEELTHFKPPIPTLQCSYREFVAPDVNRQIVNVRKIFVYLFRLKYEFRLAVKNRVSLEKCIAQYTWLLES